MSQPSSGWATLGWTIALLGAVFLAFLLVCGCHVHGDLVIYKKVQVDVDETVRRDTDEAVNRMLEEFLHGLPEGVENKAGGPG